MQQPIDYKKRFMDMQKLGSDAEPPKCQHDSCSECHGTGKKKNGDMCIHMISCRCPKCSPRYM